jgi:hypothetical protein
MLNSHLEKDIIDKQEIRNSLGGFPDPRTNAASHIELRQNAVTLSQFFENNALKDNTSAMAAHKIARESGDTTSAVKKIIRPNGGSLPGPIKARVDRDLDEYLGSHFTNQVAATNFEAFNGVVANSDVDDPRSDAQRNARQATRDLQTQYLGNDVYKTNGGFSNGTTDESQQRLMEKFGLAGVGKNNFFGKLVKECIPCGIRPMNLKDIQFSDPLIDTMKDLTRKLEELKKLLNGLMLGNQAEMDLCDLLSLLDFQCLPDLVALLSMLGMMQTKYFSGITANWKQGLNSLIAPFLSPVIGPLVHNLDRYVDLICDPLICVVEALETQLYKLDIVDADTKIRAYQYAYNRKEIDFYEQKIKSLNKRKAAVEGMLASGDANVQQGKIIPRYTRSTTEAKRPAAPPSSDPASKQSFLTNTLSSIKDLPNPRDIVQTEVEPALLGKYVQDLNTELTVISQDIQKSKTRMEELNRKNDGLGLDIAGKDKDTYEATKKARAFKNDLRSSIFQMTTVVNTGIQSVKDTLTMYRLELERLFTGRVQSQEDLIQLTRDIQQLQRWMSIVNALIKLKNKNGNLREICKRGNSSDALGAFVGEFKNSASGAGMDFYKATDDEGNELMVVAPSNALVTLTSVDFDNIDVDNLGLATINDVQNVASFNDLQEADKLNRKGMMLDLGNISGKDIAVKLNDASANKTDLDLKAERSYVIIKNDFCSKAPFKTGTSDSIRKWAENVL